MSAHCFLFRLVELLLALATKSSILFAASIVDLLARKPYWFVDSTSFSSISCPSLASIKCSNSLLVVFNRQIGLYEEGQPGGFPRFDIDTTSLVFHTSGKVWYLSKPPVEGHPGLVLSPV
ncbi:hypothetical protein Zmor_015230 [Zophobas morio]|uniref:Uncharacterized protein n=1 Tax=Zophobas morio TaxID=2755281 RepID=A0AA38IG84_9CUCU|nr:hypothetical protein Zmor_015230 [Zophobas morio]